METPDQKKKLKIRALDFAKETGVESVKFAYRSAILYVVLTVVGFFGGGVGAYIYAQSADHGFWLTCLLVLGGLGGGTITGFFTAQIVIAGLFQELLWDKGSTVAQAGYDEAKKKIVEIKDSAAKDKKSDKK